MAGEAEAAGKLVTAVAAARVVDGPAGVAGGRSSGGASGEAASPGAGACGNCAAALSGPFCSQCGQRAHVERSLSHAIHELLHGVLHFDGKLWNTLPLLVVRPGKLTRDYVEGKRARYISPIALFLLTIFLMFLVLGLIGGERVPPDAVKLDRAAAERLIAETDERIAGLDREIAARQGKAGNREALAALEASREAAVALKARVGQEIATAAAEVPLDLPASARLAAESGQLVIDTGNPALDARIAEAARNPELVFYKMKQKGYKLSFLLVPLSLPWMWLIFAGRKDVTSYDHVVFLLYSISFMSLVFILSAVLIASGMRNDGVYLSLFAVVPIVHMFLQLKEGYLLGVAAAAWRTGVLATGAVATLLLYFVGILFLGLVD